MKPAQHDLTIYRDRDFSQTFCLKSHGNAMNLTGYSARAEIRPKKDSDTLILAFSTAITPASGIITLSLTDAQTLALTYDTAYWDLVLTDTLGIRENYLIGTVKVLGTVTRATAP